MCYYFGRTKSVCEAQAGFEDGSEEAARSERLRSSSVEQEAETEAGEYQAFRIFLTQRRQP